MRIYSSKESNGSNSHCQREKKERKRENKIYGERKINMRLLQITSATRAENKDK